MTNRFVREMLEDIYGSICMSGFIISKENPLTLHHIKEKSRGGKTNLENGSIITMLPHSGIHLVSSNDFKKREFISDYLYYFKETTDLIARSQFSKWLQKEVYSLDYVPTMTKGKVLVYKRRN